MEDTCLQMKDMKGDHRDHSTSSVNKIQSNRSRYRAQDFKEDRFKQNCRNITKSNCGYCGFDHGDERKCPAYGKQCNDCERYNHFASVCRAEKKDHTKNKRHPKNRDGIRIDDVDVKVELDSGADVNVMDENQFLTFQKKTYGNPVLEKSKIKLSTLQNSLPIKGEFKTIIRNETCGTETKFIVKGKISSPPLISKSTLIELGMLQIRASGSFVKTNHLRVPDNEPIFNSGRFAIEQVFNFTT
ncbi:unnamed protein product [Mytilus coruscus]|uniref:Peptidase A2 domain-containing protein n=1 Tax=Mytilus coruscus TaxID=42192 RepID=A0A6J8EGU0_MYTCO|nr:unnamed protein product [Mytilus coruscus]